MISVFIASGGVGAGSSSNSIFANPPKTAENKNNNRTNTRTLSPTEAKLLAVRTNVENVQGVIAAGNLEDVEEEELRQRPHRQLQQEQVQDNIFATTAGFGASASPPESASSSGMIGIDRP